MKRSVLKKLLQYHYAGSDVGQVKKKSMLKSSYSTAWIVLLLFFSVLYCFFLFHPISKNQEKSMQGSVVPTTSFMSRNTQELKLNQQDNQISFFSIKPKSAIHVDTPKKAFSQTEVYRANGPRGGASKNKGEGLVSVQPILHPENTLVAGEILHAVVETAIHSDFSGFVRAVLQSPAYSLTQHRVLIPAGTRLLGHYRHSQFNHQDRIAIVWDEAITPSAYVIHLREPAVDSLGRAGVKADSRDDHFWVNMKYAGLLSLINYSLPRNDPSLGDQLTDSRVSLSDALQSQTSRIAQHGYQMKSSLILNQGAQISVFVSKNYDFSKSRG